MRIINIIIVTLIGLAALPAGARAHELEVRVENLGSLEARAALDSGRSLFLIGVGGGAVDLQFGEDDRISSVSAWLTVGAKFYLTDPMEGRFAPTFRAELLLGGARNRDSYANDRLLHLGGAVLAGVAYLPVPALAIGIEVGAKYFSSYAGNGGHGIERAQSLSFVTAITVALRFDASASDVE